MATRFEEPCEGTNGASMTGGNTAFDHFNSGTVPVFSTAQKWQGNSSMNCSTTGTYKYGVTPTVTASEVWGLRWYWRMGGFPSANSTMCELVGASLATRAQFQVITDGNIRIRNGTMSVYATSTPLSINTWYRTEWWVSATQQRMATYAGDSLTALVDSGNQTRNTGTIQEVVIGNFTNSTWSNLFLDAIIITDQAAFPGPASTPLTSDIGPDDSMLLGDSLPYLVTNTGGSGAKTYAWTLDSGPNTSTAQFSAPAAASGLFTPTLAGTYVQRCTVTDGTGPAADTATITVTEPPRIRFSRAIVIQG